MAEPMSQGLSMGAKAARSGIRAARKTLSRALDQGHARAKDIVDASGRRADESLDVVERAVIAVLDTLARQGRGYIKDARGRLHAVEARLLPHRRNSPVGTIIAGVAAGVLLSLLLAPRTTEAAVRSK